MAIKRQDEVLAKAAASDATVIPRYDIKRPDGTKVAENVALELKNTVLAEGTPINKALLNEMLTASGLVEGTAETLTLAQENFSLTDGATIKCKLRSDLRPNTTLNINGTGAKPLYNPKGETSITGVKAGAWILLIYSSTLDGYIVSSQTKKKVTKTDIITDSSDWVCPEGVTSVFVMAFGGGGAGAASGDGYGGCGGAGGHMKSSTLSVTPGNKYAITIGAGGKASTASGGNGGVTSFSTLLSANGGSGGDLTTAGSGGTGAGGSGGGTGVIGGTGSYGGNGGKGNGGGGAGDGISAAGGNGKAGTAGTGTYGGGAGGGGYGGKGGNGGNGSTTRGAGGGGGGGYGSSGNGGKGGASNSSQASAIGSAGGLAAGGGGGGLWSGQSNAAGAGGAGVVVITYVVEE